MWPLPRRSNEIVAITFTPDRLQCGWIKTSRTKAPFTLMAYQNHIFHDFELLENIIFNPGVIRTLIRNFLTRNKITNASMVFSLHGPGVIERLMRMPSSSFDLTQTPAALAHTKWDYRYLYPAEHNQFVFYIAGIKPEILFQYQLLAITGGLHLITITTHHTALLQIYYQLHGDAFRQSKLGVDMAVCDHNLRQLFNKETVHRMLANAPTDVSSDELLTLLGSYLVGKEYHEGH